MRTIKAILFILIILLGITKSFAITPPAMPENEVKFVQIIEQFASIYSQADNELTKSRLSKSRDKAILDANTPTSPQNWIGMIDDMGTNSEGKAFISIKLSNTVTFKTNNNTFLGDDGTLISQSSPMYSVLERLKIGDWIIFSCDVIRDVNLTESGRMTAPDFLVRFTDIKPLK